jgi:hypothetical protein
MELLTAFTWGRFVLVFFPVAFLLTFLAAARAVFRRALLSGVWGSYLGPRPRFRLSISTHSFSVFLLSHVGSVRMFALSAN